MTPFFYELIKYIATYLAVILLFLIVTNFLTKGFLFKYLIVRASQGKKVLVRVWSVTDIYYVVGSWNEGFFIYKIRNKELKRIPIQDLEFKKYIHSEMAVFCINTDEEGTKFLDSSLEATTFANIDPGRTESLFLRIKNRPTPKDKYQLIIILGIGLLIAMMIISLVMLKRFEPIIAKLSTLAGNV
jgi:hypothetical protein